LEIAVRGRLALVLRAGCGQRGDRLASKLEIDQRSGLLIRMRALAAGRSTVD
jgi:hypothetical protein